MDELSRKFRSIDWKGLQKQARKVQASTASALKDMVMTDLENKTRAATADTSWGASGADLMAIAHGTYRREDYTLIMSIVWQRLASSRRRCVYKALELLKFLIMHGATRCTDEARAALPHLRMLTEYVSVDEHGRDAGDGVRKRAVIVCQMLADDQVLEEERMKSRELRSKLQGGADAPGGRLGGVSSDDYRFSNRNYNSGGAQYDNGNNVSGTPAFKGYGDDDDTDQNQGYDDVPHGQFAQRAKQAAGVDDLLGDDDAPGNNGGVEDGDDEDFDPRGNGTMVAVSANGNGQVDLFAELNNLGDSSDTHNNNSGANGSANNSEKIPTSQLILQMAAEREQQSNMQVAVVNQNGENGSSSGSHQIGGGEGSAASQSNGAAGDDFFFGGGLTGEETAAAATATSAAAATTQAGKSGEKRVLTNITEKEKDPFADLLSSGKQSGLL